MTDYKFVEPKTQASIRTIYIDSDTLNELKAWQSVQQQVLPDCPLVLSYNGTPTSKTTLPRALEKLSNLAGVHRIKIHALQTFTRFIAYQHGRKSFTYQGTFRT